MAGLFALFILWKHDAEAMWAATGSVVNSWISITLKKILNHERPNAALRSDPGMPSSHAQSIFYTACFAVFSCKHTFITLRNLSLYLCLRMNPIAVLDYEMYDTPPNLKL